jgi:hypothetical protein
MSRDDDNSSSKSEHNRDGEEEEEALREHLSVHPAIVSRATIEDSHRRRLGWRW